MKLKIELTKYIFPIEIWQIEEDKNNKDDYIHC